MEIKAQTGEHKHGGDLVGLERGESINASFLEGVSDDWFVELPIVGIGSIDRLKWNQLNWIGRQVRGLLLFSLAFVVNMLQFVGCLLQYGGNMPGTSTCKLQFIKNFTGRVGLNSTSGKDNVINGINPRVRPSSVDELVMIGELFFNKVCSNLATC